eukprot:1196073-Prorocentrum_minimum.AAC.3
MARWARADEGGPPRCAHSKLQLEIFNSKMLNLTRQETFERNVHLERFNAKPNVLSIVVP